MFQKPKLMQLFLNVKRGWQLTDSVNKSRDHFVVVGHFVSKGLHRDLSYHLQMLKDKKLSIVMLWKTTFNLQFFPLVCWNQTKSELKTENGNSIFLLMWFKEEVKENNFFCLKIIFLSGLIGKFHIKFTDDKIFERLVSTKKVQWSYQWLILLTPSVNHLVSTIKGH